MRSLLLLLAFAVPSLALADQCLSLPKDKAEAARKAVEGKKVIWWKAPAGQAKPTTAKAAKKVKHVTVRPSGEGDGAFEVHFEGPAMDLAFVYVEESAKKYHNVADLIQCPTQGVEPVLELK